MPRKGKCAQCQHDLLECKSKEVKKLPCKHYCHSLCIVSLHEEEENEERACGQCGRRIHNHWLNTTVDDIKEQQRIDEGVDYQAFYIRFSLKALDTIDDGVTRLQGSIGMHGMVCHSTEIRYFVEYIDMLQKVLTLVQQLEDNDRKNKEK